MDDIRAVMPPDVERWAVVEEGYGAFTLFTSRPLTDEECVAILWLQTAGMAITFAARSLEQLDSIQLALPAPRP